ncbi:MAG: FAD-dependent oxidoreductase [Acidobacteria bacterium]|nr:FAD-dependent oxidoreductase [Acidobacteriota bacterium]
MSASKRHFVAVIGGAVAGSVAAELLADHGIRVAVIEQNPKPYGKIEDGLPRWHVEQRKQEYARIDARIKKPGVVFVPSTKIGAEIDFKELTEGWGFSAVILANGAWRDRDIGIAGADAFIGKGLIYQNPFIYWYNHKNEKTYSGPRYDAPDETLVLGGGLASIDVVKALQLENYERALKARGIPASMHEMEKKGIAAFCKTHGVDPASLGVKGCLLIYRRREQDMPLQQPPENATPEQLAKTEDVRRKVLRLAREKFLFRFQDRRLTQGLVVENGRLVGIKVAETHVEGRKATPIAGTEHELRAPLIISSIGSVPEVIPGIAMKGEYYEFTDTAVARYKSNDRVFGVGNVVTGQGNIRVSLIHSQKTTEQLIENYLGVGEDDEGSRDISGFTAPAEARGAAQAQAVKEKVQTLSGLSEEQIAAIDRRIQAHHQRVGYGGDYDAWIKKVTPPDLE